MPRPRLWKAFARPRERNVKRRQAADRPVAFLASLVTALLEGRFEQPKGAMRRFPKAGQKPSRFKPALYCFSERLSLAFSKVQKEMLKPIVSFCLSLALTSCGTQTLYDRGSELDRLISSGSKALSDKQYSQAEAIFLELMKKAERSNPNSREYNLSLHKLAEVYFEQGQYTKAEPLLQK